jgi:hypothetical protein
MLPFGCVGPWFGLSSMGKWGRPRLYQKYSPFSDHPHCSIAHYTKWYTLLPICLRADGWSLTCVQKCVFLLSIVCNWPSADTYHCFSSATERNTTGVPTRYLNAITVHVTVYFRIQWYRWSSADCVLFVGIRILITFNQSATCFDPDGPKRHLLLNK